MENKRSQTLKTPAEILRPEPVDSTHAILLSAIFGPLGLVYSTINGAVIMYMIALPLAMITEGFALLIIWPICIVLATIESREIEKKIF